MGHGVGIPRQFPIYRSDYTTMNRFTGTGYTTWVLAVVAFTTEAEL